MAVSGKNISAKRERTLTKRYVDGLSVPGEYYEQEIKGFYVRVTSIGTKTYYVENSVKGGRSNVAVKIGRHDQISTADARLKAREILLLMSQGVDPNRARKKDKHHAEFEQRRHEQEDAIKGITLGEVLVRYLKERSLKRSTAIDYERLAKLCFTDWLSKPITSIGKDAVEQRFRSISERSKAQANKAMRVLRALFNYADAAYEDSSGRSIVPENPTKRLKQLRAWHRIDRRETVIKDHDLAAWYKAVMSLENSTVRDYLRLLLFTGLRRSEAARLLWQNVDFKGKTLTVTDTKNHRDHMVPMSDFVQAMLWQRRNELLSEGSYGAYVFPGPGDSGFLNDPRKQILKVIEKSQVQFTSHDLRRTMSTIADRIGIDKFTVGRLLNHKTAGVTEGYIISDAERLREPLQQVTNYICAKAGIKGVHNVSPKRRTQR